MDQRGFFNVWFHSTEGIEKAPQGLVDLYSGGNMGKAVIKW
jgi:NADPH-dependent curcumin reductase CurA